jgi:hypothetical protein
MEGDGSSRNSTSSQTKEEASDVQQLESLPVGDAPQVPDEDATVDVGHSALEVKDDEDISSESSEDTPEWMSFIAPESAPEVDLFANFEALWSDDLAHESSIGESQGASQPVTELTSDALWGLLGPRFNEELERRVKEAEVKWRKQQVQLMRRKPRPRRGERGELVAELASQVAQKAIKAKPAAWRFGKTVGAGAANAALAVHETTSMIRENSPILDPHMALTPEVDARRRAKVAHAANAISSGLLRSMPKSLASRLRRTQTS